MSGRGGLYLVFASYQSGAIDIFTMVQCSQKGLLRVFGPKTLHLAHRRGQWLLPFKLGSFLTEHSGRDAEEAAAGAVGLSAL